MPKWATQSATCDRSVCGGDWLRRRGLERGVGGEEAGEVEAARVAVETRRRVAVEGAAASCKARRRVTGEVRQRGVGVGGEQRAGAAASGEAWRRGEARPRGRRVLVSGLTARAVEKLELSSLARILATDAKRRRSQILKWIYGLWREFYLFSKIK